MTDKDKEQIEKKAEKLLKGLDNLMNKSKGENNVIEEKIIPIKDSEGKTSIVVSKSFDIMLGTGVLDNAKLSEKDEKDIFNNSHFESKISVKTLLKEPSIIEERILKPVQKLIKEVDDTKTNIYTKFMDAHATAMISINKLSDLGGISLYEKGIKMLMQDSIYNNVYSLKFQSSNINRDNVFALLR